MSRRQKNLFPDIPDGKKYVSDVPELMETWHPTKNSGIRPEDLTTGSGVKVWWICELGHEWLVSVDNRSRSKHNGCARCSKRGVMLDETYRREKHEELSAIAIARGGKLISTEYLGMGKAHEWECAFGHRWKVKPDHVVGKSQSWCQKCNQTYSEKIIRLALEAVFKLDFPSVRPDFLKSTNGRNLELDGYCEHLNLAFEFDGAQHFKKTRFQESERILSSIQARDAEKNKLVFEQGITLLRFNYLEDFRNVPQLIKSKIPNDRHDLEAYDFDVTPDYTSAFIPDDPLIELQTLAHERGGRLISTIYINSDTKLEWECSEGHRWWQKPDHVKNTGTWCKSCAVKNAWAKRKAQSTDPRK